MPSRLLEAYYETGSIDRAIEPRRTRLAVIHAPAYARVEDVADPQIRKPSDGYPLPASCIRGSEQWPYRGADAIRRRRTGHEDRGVVEERPAARSSGSNPASSFVGAFFASDNTCEVCRSCASRRRCHPSRSRRAPLGRAGAVDADRDVGRIFDKLGVDRACNSFNFPTSGLRRGQRHHPAGYLLVHVERVRKQE